MKRVVLLRNAIDALQSPQSFAGDTSDSQEEAMGWINLFLTKNGEEPYTSFKDGSGLYIADDNREE